MSARIYWPSAWSRAREHRARSGQAPRLAVRRSIVLREVPGGGAWAAAIHEWRAGHWKSPTWLCGKSSLPTARAAALEAWREKGLPILWAYDDERFLRPFYEGVNEPEARV